jgi:hypothetical protein
MEYYVITKNDACRGLPLMTELVEEGWDQNAPVIRTWLLLIETYPGAFS